MTVLGACTLAVTLSLVAGSDELVLEHRTAKVLWQKVVVPDSEFTLDSLKSRFERALQRESARFQVIKLEVFVDKQEALSNRKGATDVSYDSWEFLYRDYETKIPPSAELLMIRNNAAMRVRDQRGGVVSTVLRGKDPYTVWALGKKLALVHMAAYKGAPLRDQSKKFVDVLSFFLMADDDFDERAAKAITQGLIKETGIKEIQVVIRPDPWFISDDNFPVVSPYVRRTPPPSKVEYDKTPEWVCVADTRSIGCFGKHPH